MQVTATAIVAIVKFNESEKDTAIQSIKQYVEMHGLRKAKFTKTSGEVDLETGDQIESATVEYKATVEFDGMAEYQSFKAEFDQTNAGQRIRYDDAVKERALKLLAQGKSYDAVATEIGCSKNTVVKWKKDAPKDVDAEAA